MGSRSFALIKLFILLTAGGQSQDTIKLSYREFRNNILDHHPLSKQAKNTREYGNFQLKAARGSYDPQIQGNFDQKNLKQVNYYTEFYGEIKQPLFTQQYIKAGYNFGSGAYLNPELFTPVNGQPFLGVELGLLQGLTLDKRRAEVLKAKEYVNYYNAESQILVNDLVLSTSETYFSLLLNHQQQSLNSLFLALAKDRLSAIASQVAVGEKAAVDTIEAAILLQTRLLDYQSSHLEGLKLQNEVALNFNAEHQLPGPRQVFVPENDLDYYFLFFKTRFGSLLSDTNFPNPVLKKMNAFQNILEVEKRWKREQIKPSLNVSYNFLPTYYNSLPALSALNCKWGFTLNFPLLLRHQRNQFKMAQINADINSLNTAFKANDISIKTGTLEQSYVLLMDQLKNTERTLTYSRALLNAEKEKFNIGESSLFLLNTREAKLLETELKYATLKYKFIHLCLQLLHVRGALANDFI